MALTARSADMREEKKGPRVGAPEKAIEGFLRGAGLASIDEATIQSDPKKGDFYVARVTKPGRAAEEIVAELVPAMIRDFPWPKSMRWGARSAPRGQRARRGGGGEPSLGAAAPLDPLHLRAGDRGADRRRFRGAGIARRQSSPTGTASWRAASRSPCAASTIMCRRSRRRRSCSTRSGGRRSSRRRRSNLAFAQGLELVEDAGLLEEVAGLVEWPVVLMGSFDAAFLAIPDEVIRLTIRPTRSALCVREPQARAR